MLADYKEITIYEVEKLQVLFLQELLNAESLELDMKSIKKIDMVGIQLLLSLVKTAHSEHKKISFKNIANNILSMIKQAHCEKELGLDI